MKIWRKGILVIMFKEIIKIMVVYMEIRFQINIPSLFTCIVVHNRLNDKERQNCNKFVTFLDTSKEDL